MLKIAKKRANVDAVKSTTAASDIFTQDIEDMPQAFQAQQPKPQAPAAPPQPRPIDEYKLALIRARDERGVPVKDAMAKVRETISKPPEEYDAADVASAVAIVNGLGLAEHEYEVVEELPLAEDDIPF